MSSFNDVIDIEQFSKEDMEKIFSVADEMQTLIGKPNELCKGKVMATIFYEPSTRTRLSFESAMHRLGGSVITVADPKTSSIKKGESVADTVRVLEKYADVIVMRTPMEGSAKVAAEYSSVPIINGGDGTHQHPTQTLLDIYTMKKRFGKVEGLNVLLCGDLKFGRTSHSLAYALAKSGANIKAVSPKGLELPDWLVSRLKSDYGTTVEQGNEIEKMIGWADVLYVTRIQKERFLSEKEYLKVRGSYKINKTLLEKAKKEMIVMHPLPRVNEIDYDVDSDGRAYYFEQAGNGVPVRMALIAMLLGVRQ